VPGEGEGLRRVANAFDFVLSTVSADLPWDAYLETLRPHGTLCVVGMSGESLTVDPRRLLTGERSVAGGVTGPPAQIRLMLDFVARHGIRPAVETFPVARMEEALDHVRHGRARYRAVLEF
jgi:alcohol/geraniol dehydrogenase (NADP+)